MDEISGVNQIVTKASQLRVVVFTPCFHVLDGVSLTIRKIRDEVLLQGGKLIIATSSHGKDFLLHEDDCPEDAYIFCNSEPLPYDSTDSYSLCRMIDDDVKQKVLDFNPNVIHITSPDPLCFSVAEWTRIKLQKAQPKKFIPLIATWHSNIPDYMDHVGPLQRIFFKPILQYVFQTCYAYPMITYVPNATLAEKMRGQGFEAKETGTRLKVWGRGVDIGLFDPNRYIENRKTIRNKLKIKDDQVVIIWVGRCVKEKRTDIWIHVLENLIKKYPKKVVGFIVGRGEGYDKMQAVDQRRVKGFGWRQRDELAEVYASADVLLFPSGVETFGNVTLEGMASGLPCVVDRGCSAHLIEDGKSGYTCKTFEEYFEACEKLVLDKESREAMSKYARKTAVEKFERKFVLNQMVQNYIATANAKPEDMPPFEYTRKYYIVKLTYNFIDKGGFIAVKIVGSFAFYWKGADKVVEVGVGLVLLLAILFYYFMG